MTNQTLPSSESYILLDRVQGMTTLPERLQMILSEMEGPDHGKQKRLADLAGCQRATITHYLKNPGSVMGYEYAKNLADALSYSVDWLILGRGGPHEKGLKKAPISLTYVDQAEADLLSMYRESTPEGKVYIISSARMTEKLPSAKLAILSSPHKLQ